MKANCINGSWRPQETPICVSDTCQDLVTPVNGEVEQLDTWRGYKVTRGSVLRYTCQPGHVLEGDQIIWCDGLLWNSSVPVCTAPISRARTSCNFDDVDVDPLCGWSQRLVTFCYPRLLHLLKHSSDDDDFDWLLTSEATPTPGTGPSSAYDGTKEVHRSQIDYYLYYLTIQFKVQNCAQFNNLENNFKERTLWWVIANVLSICTRKHL